MANLTLQRAYERDLARELVRQPPHPSPALARKELTTLPNAVREYVLASGSLDRAHASNARIVWREMLLQNSEGAQTLRVDCEQVNFLREPSRMALMRSALAGVIPFSGYDRYRNGRGEMLIRLGGICPLRHARGPHMDASGLATFLSEALLLPLLFVHPSLQWSALDERSARATIHHAGTFVSGVFSFDAANEWARFETCDRWRDGRPPVRQRWSAEVTDFAWHKGLRIPGRARAFWHADARRFCYMRGRVESITYDVTDARAQVGPRRFSLARTLSSWRNDCSPSEQARAALGGSDDIQEDPDRARLLGTR